MTANSLKREDIHIGMEVMASSLRDILDTYITLVDSVWQDGDVFGRIAFIGSEITPEADRVSEENSNVFAIYNARDEYEGEVTYDE
mgnify:CR=1 FL=1